MTGSSQSGFGTIDTPFPPAAYMMFVFMMSNEGTMMGVYPLSTIFTSATEVSAAVKEMVAASSDREVTVPEVGILVPITLDHLIPMQENFWDSPAEHYDMSDRLNVFLPVANQPQLYKLLVTPSHYEEGLWHFNAAAPFLLTAQTRQIEQFMRQADYAVDIRAKHAAIYTFGDPISFNWMTGEEKQVSKHTEFEPKDLN